MNRKWNFKLSKKLFMCCSSSHQQRKQLTFKLDLLNHFHSHNNTLSMWIFFKSPKTLEICKIYSWMVTFQVSLISSNVQKVCKLYQQFNLLFFHQFHLFSFHRFDCTSRLNNYWFLSINICEFILIFISSKIWFSKLFKNFYLNSVSQKIFC